MSETTIQLSDAERQPCEVWTRVMGYYRPVDSMNIGKKAEHEERLHYTEEAAAAHEANREKERHN